MKKIFTMLGGLLLASTLSAQAEEVTVSITDLDWKYIADSQTAELTKDSEGNFTIANFLWSDSPVSFKFEKPEIDGAAALTITSPTEVDGEGWENYPYLMSKDGSDYIDCAVYNLNDDGDWTNIYYPYAYLPECKVYRYDLTQEYNTYEYYACICMTGTLADGSDAPYMYVGFFFNDPGNTGDEPGDEPTVEPQVVSSTTVTCQILDWNSWEEVGESYEATLTLLDNDVYTLQPFLGDGNTISFKIGEFGDAIDYEAEAEIEFVGNVVVDGYYEDAEGEYCDKNLMNPSDPSKEMICSYTTLAGNKFTLKYPYVTEGSGYASVSKYLDYQEQGYKQFCGYIPLIGYDNLAKDWLYYFITFEFDALSDDTTGIANNEANDNAPILFYNLNGQRVENPSNGIFIRKQGTKTSKVIIR